MQQIDEPAVVEQIDETIRPVATFPELGTSAEVTAALAGAGIERAFPIQALVIPDAIEGKDVLAKSRTGSGKTLAFAVPIVERLERTGRPAALILVPTRELALQVAETFSLIAGTRGLKVATVYGGVGLTDQGKRAARSDVIVATPGRLLDQVRRNAFKLDGVRVAVLDEADRMLDMGFLPDVSTILGMLPAEGRQTMLFSATLDGDVAVLARRYTHDAVRHEVVDARPVVTEANHRFIPVAPGEKTAALVNELTGERGLTLVFVRTKRGADRLAKTLQDNGFRAQALHGDMTQPAREKALARFERGDADVLVATDVAARGLDLEKITHVVNYDPPEDDKAYVHRVGRTARAGRAGTGITFVLPDQRADVSRVAARLKLHDEISEAGMKVHPPRKVFQGGTGKNRLLGKRPRRRF